MWLLLADERTSVLDPLQNTLGRSDFKAVDSAFFGQLLHVGLQNIHCIFDFGNEFFVVFTIPRGRLKGKSGVINREESIKISPLHYIETGN